MSFGPALARFIRDTIGPLFTYASHPGAVVAQAADGTVEVKPDSPVVAPQKGVPLVLGVPGIKVKVGPGTRVRLSFASGSPGASEVALWEGDGLLELELDASVKVTVTAPQVVLDAADVRLGGPTAAQQVVMGTTYRAAEDTMLTALSAALTALGGTVPPAGAGPLVATALHATAWANAIAAITTFQAAAANYLSTTVKTK